MAVEGIVQCLTFLLQLSLTEYHAEVERSLHLKTLIRGHQLPVSRVTFMADNISAKSVQSVSVNCELAFLHYRLCAA